MGNVIDRLCETEANAARMKDVIQCLSQQMEEMEDNGRNISGDAQIINPETGEPYTVVVEPAWDEYDEENDDWIYHEAKTGPLTMALIAEHMVADWPYWEERVKDLEYRIEGLYRPLQEFLGCNYWDTWYTGEKLVEFLDDLKSRLDALDGGGGVDVDPVDEAELCPDGNHPHMIDLGLPDGTKWACCNVGATKPWESGGFYAWGETEPKSEYGWSTYFDTEDGGYTFKKYNNNGGLTELLPEDDAATANWGSGWQTPSIAQMQELINNEYTTTEWATMNGVNGIKITSSSNGNSVFFPAAGGCWDDDEPYYAGVYGYYWSSSLDSYEDGCAGYLNFNLDTRDWGTSIVECYEGLSVRPVRVQE